MKLGRYSKFITAIVGFAITVISAKYPGTNWLPYLIAAAGALGVYGVPNTPPQPPSAPAVVQFTSQNTAAQLSPVDLATGESTRPPLKTLLKPSPPETPTTPARS